MSNLMSFIGKADIVSGFPLWAGVQVFLPCIHPLPSDNVDEKNSPMVHQVDSENHRQDLYGVFRRQVPETTQTA